MRSISIQYGHAVDELPHGTSPAGIQIPHWEEMLLIASRFQYITNIGYLAVDLTIDQDQGPVLLEVNARAGLAVQLANLAPLRSRLERIQGVTVTSPEKGVAIAQQLFGQKVRPSVSKQETDRPVLGMRESIVISCDGATVEVPCLIAPQFSERSLFTS